MIINDFQDIYKYLIPATMLLWIFWIVVARLMEEFGKKTQNPFVLMVYSVFYIFDVLFNVVYGSIGFLQLPRFKQLTLTARLKNILLSGDFQETEWRFKVALFVCKKMISPWEWNHCGMGFGKRTN